MGLSGPRKRTKISHDPNNTSWSRSTSGYGHKIMSSQGWTPGSFLGASDAPHAADFTAASAGHIRVILKDDTLGLGARARNSDEPTGLDAFQGLLGRLNGKSDAELQQEQKKKDDIRLAKFVANRWKTMRFVSGGLLVHEKLQKLADAKPVQLSESSQQEKPEKPEKSKKERKKEKRKAKAEDDAEQSEKSSKKEKKKKKKRSRDDSETSKGEDSGSTRDGTPAEDTKSEKKSKKSKKRKQKEIESNETEQGNNSSTESGSPAPEIKPKAVAPKPDSVLKVREHRPLGRQFTRGRYIQQKKMAIMDAKSLNEIFMVKG
ncbi:telomerase inhibitor [Onygenales sp. PD_12]|nr:telomerase inhibitor [Onygenales sp. PD_12]